jgi:hypothetical protein
MGGREHKVKAKCPRMTLKLSLYGSFNMSADGSWSVGESFVCGRVKVVFSVYSIVQRVFDYL